MKQIDHGLVFIIREFTIVSVEIGKSRKVKGLSNFIR